MTINKDVGIGENGLIDMSKIRRATGPQVMDASMSSGKASSIQLRKCKPQEFMRINKDLTERYENAMTIEFSTAKAKDVFLLMGEWAVPEGVMHLVKPMHIFRACNHLGGEFLYYYRPSLNDWSVSAAEVVRAAVDEWVRPVADMDGQTYIIKRPAAPIAEPVWSILTFPQLLTLAFKNKLLTSPESRIIRLIEGSSSELNQPAA